MTDREELIELLSEAEKVCFVPMWLPPEERLHSLFSQIADHLLANGVTVQQWIPVTERLPEESGLYITFGCTAVPVRWLHNFDKDIGKFGAWWNYEPDGKEYPQYRFIEAGNITHWTPLPEPPKGE